jgi:hypothetical protein
MCFGYSEVGGVLDVTNKKVDRALLLFRAGEFFSGVGKVDFWFWFPPKETGNPLIYTRGGSPRPNTKNPLNAPACWVLPGLGNVSCLSGPVRPLRLIVCVISSLPSARLQYRQKAATCLAIYVSVLPVTVPACIAVMSVTYTSLRAQALALVFG